MPRLYVRFGETRNIKQNTFDTSEHLDFVVVDQKRSNKLDLFNDYMIARTVLHPKAKSFEIENNLAILFLATDVEFSGELNQLN